MFARVLVVGDERLAEASLAWRVGRALERVGHAVCLVSGEAALARRIAAYGRGFRPTVCLVEKSCSSLAWAAVEALGVPLIEMGGNSGGAAHGTVCVQDPTYRAAGISLPIVDRSHDVALVQGIAQGRQDAVEALCSCGVDVVTFDPSWGRGWCDPALGVGAYTLRTTKLVVLFAGADAPSLAEASLRASEGAMLLVEDALAAQWGADAPTCLMTFSSEGLVDIVRHFLDDEDARRAVLVRQEAWLDGLPTLDDALDDALEHVHATSGDVLVLAHAARNVVVYGWFGEENFGDDLLLQVVADRVFARYPEAVIHVMAGNPDRVRDEYGFDAVRAGDYHLMRRMLVGADALVFCGGLVFDDPLQETAGDIETFMEPFINPTCQAGACLMAWLCGVPQLYLGAGIGPAAKPATRNSLRYIGLSGARLLLRDEDSARLALDAGVCPEQVEVYTDLVLSARGTVLEHAAPSLPAGLVDGGYVMVALRTWPLNPIGFERTLASELDRIVRETGLVVAFVPFDADDVHIHRVVASYMESGKVVEIAERPDVATMFAIVEHSATCVAMRLHCSILHHVLGKPAVGIDYNEKVGSHFREMGREDRLIPLDGIDGHLAAMVSETLSHPSEERCSVEAGLDRLVPRAEAVFKELFDTIDAHVKPPAEQEVYQPRGISLQAQELGRALERERRLSERVSELEGELAQARARVDDLERSTSYRLGHALVKVPHALFKRD